MDRDIAKQIANALGGIQVTLEAILQTLQPEEPANDSEESNG